jgi:hypothetical protein
MINKPKHAIKSSRAVKGKCVNGSEVQFLKSVNDTADHSQPGSSDQEEPLASS